MKMFSAKINLIIGFDVFSYIIVFLTITIYNNVFLKLKKKCSLNLQLFNNKKKLA